MKKFIGTLLIIGIIGTAGYYGFKWYKGKQEVKIAKLEDKIHFLKKETVPLQFKILEKDIQKGKEQGQPISIFYFSILLLIIILIIISIIIMILIRKKASKKDSEVVESQEIIPETTPESITTPEPEPIVEPLPGITQQQDETLEE